MPIGLRQGCVLSPILFALYICDLENELVESGLGIQINDIIVGALFFADDIMLAGTKEQLQKLMRKVLVYSEKNKLEFSGVKIIVIPLFRDPVKDAKIWEIGVIPKKDSEGIVIGMFIRSQNPIQFSIPYLM